MPVGSYMPNAVQVTVPQIERVDIWQHIYGLKSSNKSQQEKVRIRQKNKRVLDALKEGDLVRFHRIMYRLITYEHYAVYIGKVEESGKLSVIHWYPDPTDYWLTRPKSSIRTDAFWTVACYDEVENGNDFQKEHRAYDGDNVVKKAKRKQDQFENPSGQREQYHLFTNNCEHFARECRYGLHESSQAPPSNVTWDTDCGVTKGCFPDCRTSVCSHLVTWQDAGASVRFVITSSISVGCNERWMANGFLDNFKMSDKSMSECDYFGGNIQVKSSYNDGYENHLLSNDILGVRLLGSGVNGGKFMCSFLRLKSVAGEQKFFNISQSRILFFATGKMSGGVKQQHKYKEMSDGKVDFEKFGIPGAGEEDKTLIKIHACLMTVAWIFLSSVGVVVARHCKTAFPNSTIFKQRVWFQIHRTCMTLTFTCTAAAFVVIFVKVGGLSQPIMAFFRPHPGEKCRPIFNWAHWFVGTSAHILAAITIFFGLNLEMAGVNYTANYMLVGYVGAFVFVQLILEIYRRSRTKAGIWLALKTRLLKLRKHSVENLSLYTLDVQHPYTIFPSELGNLVSSQTYLLAKDKPRPNDTGSFQSCVTFVHAVLMLGIVLTLIAVIVES